MLLEKAIAADGEGGARGEEAAGAAEARRSAKRKGPGGERRTRTATCSGIEPLEPSDIEAVLDTATALREVLDRPIKKVPALRGKTVVNLFYEASTRTRASFEIAEKVLSADSLSIATATSSVQKGETLLDTAKNLEAMNPDMIVIRHASSGAPHFLARHCRSAIVNAGDGAHEHPTQALLDAFTLRQKKGRLAGPARGHRRRRDAQPGRALERLAADQDGRGRDPLRAAHADAAGHRARWPR